ncbi:DUF58 domain-containing protein [Janibacter alkaliphilus]
MPTGDERLQEMASAVQQRARGNRRTVTLPGAPVTAYRGTQQAGRAVARGAVAADARVRRTWLGGHLDWITRLGWSTLALGLACGLLAVLLGWVELALVAVLAVMVVVLCVAAAVGRHRADVELSVVPARVDIGERCRGRVVITNASRRTMLPSLVRLPVGGQESVFVVPLLRRRARHSHTFEVDTGRRGVVPVGPPRTEHGDPLGITRRVKTFGGTTSVHVHPRRVALESGAHGLLVDLEGQATPKTSMADITFHALRDYEPGDDRRYVHWRSSAKHGRLLVRQFQETRRSHLSVVVDTDPAMYPAGGEDDVETAISVAASLMVQSIVDEQEATVVCRDRSASRTTVPLVLDALTTASTGRVDLVRSARQAVALAPDSSVAVLVSGPGRAFLELQQCLGEFETEVHTVVVVVDPGAAVGLRRLRGLVVVTITALEDLSRVRSGLAPA